MIWAMVRKGKHTYIPPSVIDEVNDIIKEKKLMMQVQGMNEMVKYCRVGREVERLKNFDFSTRTLLPPVNTYPTKKFKKWKYQRVT
jgi:hypothetical protein